MAAVTLAKNTDDIESPARLTSCGLRGSKVTVVLILLNSLASEDFHNTHFFELRAGYIEPPQGRQ